MAKKGKEKKPDKEENALAVKEENVGLGRTLNDVFTKEQKDLIKRNYAKHATDDELAIYFNFCEKAGVDPLRGQSHFIKYKEDSKPIMMIGIDGFQARATADLRYEGMVANVVYENDNFSMDPVDGKIAHSFGAKARGKLIGAYAILRRKGMPTAVQWVSLAEYIKPTQENWKTMPEVMITKVARATLLRREYPDNFSGVYVPEEFGAEITEKGDFIDQKPKQPEPFPEGKSTRTPPKVQDAEYKDAPEKKPEPIPEPAPEPEPEEEPVKLIPADVIDKTMTPRDALKAIMTYAWKEELGKKVRPFIIKHFESWESGEYEVYHIPENNVIAIVEDLTGIKLKKAEKSKKCKECDQKITEPEAEEQDGLCLKDFKKKQESEQ